MTGNYDSLGPGLFYYEESGYTSWYFQALNTKVYACVIRIISYNEQTNSAASCTGNYVPDIFRSANENVEFKYFKFTNTFPI
jgi:hypothetical protein